MVLYLSFHPQNDVTVNSSLAHIEKTMVAHFGDKQEKVFMGKAGHEVVYRVATPFFPTADEMKDFFLEMRELFLTCSAWQPHFTQFQENEAQ